MDKPNSLAGDEIRCGYEYASFHMICYGPWSSKQVSTHTSSELSEKLETENHRISVYR